MRKYTTDFRETGGALASYLAPMIHIALLLAAAVMSATTLLAETPPSGAVTITPTTIPWEPPASDGSRFALLDGKRMVAGETFSYAFALPAGGWDRPHSHSTTARIFVLKGVLKLGWGRQMDKARARAFPAGSFVVVPAGAVHFDGADEETIILGVASGIWATRYVDGSAGSAGTPRQ